MTDERMALAALLEKGSDSDIAERRGEWDADPAQPQGQLPEWLND